MEQNIPGRTKDKKHKDKGKLSAERCLKIVISHTATCSRISGACPSAQEHQGDPSVPPVFALADHPKPPAPASCAAPTLPANDNRCHQCHRLSCPLGSTGISGAISGPAMALKCQQDLPLQSWARSGVLGAPLAPSSGLCHVPVLGNTVVTLTPELWQPEQQVSRIKK